VLGNRAQNFISSDNGTRTLTIAAGHTLRGGGNLGSPSYGNINLVNQGTVLAEGSSGMAASVGSFDNTAGVLQVGDNSVFTLAAGSLTGGSVRGGTGAVIAGNGSFSQTVLRNGLTLRGGQFSNLTLQDTSTVGDAGVIGLAGNITNTGTLALASNGNITRLVLAADTTLSGNGQTVLGNRAQNFISSNDGQRTLTIAAGHTLRSSGGNLGTDSYGRINVVNRGLVVADAGGLPVHVGTFNNTAGTLQVADGGFVSLNGGSLFGGTVMGSGSAYLAGNGLYRDLSLAGSLRVSDGSTVLVAGNIDNTGAFTLASNGNITRLVLAADTTLSGSGQTVLGNRAQNFISSNDGQRTLTIAAGHTLRGGGNLGSPSYGNINFVNQGTVLVSAAETMQVATGANGFKNQGQLLVATGGTLNATNSPSSIMQSANGAMTTVDGTLHVSQLTLQAGGLQGSGTIRGNVVNLGGTIGPGNSPGKLSVVGDLTLGAGSLMLIEVAGRTTGTQHDWVNVTGNVLLGGDLRLDFGSYTPQIGEQYTFLTASGGSISGSFRSAVSDGYGLSLQYGSQGVIATVAVIPEPKSLALMLLGVATLACYRRRVEILVRPPAS